ncbi:sugar transferase [Thioclava sp. BHET1]|nr:sugar transferase [Thioclava sp. BHET1]
MSFDLFRIFESGGTSLVEVPYTVKKPKQYFYTPVGGGTKRCLDLVLIALFIPLFLPLLAGLCLLVKLSDKGPIFYGHKRIGFNGREFRCWKFRTMVVDGDAVLERHLKANPQARAMWLRERKLDDDPRVTALGVVLRKLSLDELPQLYNVLSGEMSIVGPRPVVHAELANYSGSVKHYLRTRPGVTGLWQVSGRSDMSYRDRVKLDRFYASRWSNILDLWVLARTVPAVLMSRGAR